MLKVIELTKEETDELLTNNCVIIKRDGYTFFVERCQPYGTTIVHIIRCHLKLYNDKNIKNI